MRNHTAPKNSWLFIKEWTPEFLEKPIKLLDPHERWRRVAKILKVSKEARRRLEWIIYYREGHSASEVARHFGITKKTFHKWNHLFDEDNLQSLKRLQDRSKAPLHVRSRTITPTEKERVVRLRKTYPRYGKMKLVYKYEQQYQEKISSWKIQKVIEEKRLYFNLTKTKRTTKKRLYATKKKRIIEAQKSLFWHKRAGFIICLDTIILHWNGVTRVIFTAIDKYGKVAYARMYPTKSTINARDFLYRLYFLSNEQLVRVGHDNGSEFQKWFAVTCKELHIIQFWSRVRTPKDNAVNERFNRTLEDEFIALGNMTTDIEWFNKKLTEWLIEYNFKRPHQSLGYQTPIFYSQLSPMYSSCTCY